HHDLGVSLEKQAAYREAEAHYRQAIKIWQTMGNDNDLSNSLTHLGGILSKRGEHDEALALLKESQEIALSVGAIRRAAFAIAGMGDTHFRRQAYEEAIKAYRLSTGYAQDAQVQYLEVSNQIQISDCLYYLNQDEDHAEALRQAEQARATAAAIGLALEEGLAVTIQAKIYVKLGQYQEGIQHLAEAVTYITTNNPVDYVIARLWWAYALWLTDKHGDALEQLEQAVQFIPPKNGLPPELKHTVSEVRACLTYFVNQASVSDEVRAGLDRLLETRSVED
ncbi:MAG: tetratricopeptide repeat protein, partial [Anaerolineae bacterium]|nr:tetratricopeptide repeat protein [Anaerolineae bacterium]